MIIYVIRTYVIKGKKYANLEGKTPWFSKIISINNIKDIGGFEFGICGSVMPYLLSYVNVQTNMIDTSNFVKHLNGHLVTSV